MVVDDPPRFFFDLGLLHDARVLELNWTDNPRALRLGIGDYRIAISDAGAPAKSITLQFSEVSDVNGAFDDSYNVVSEFEVREISSRQFEAVMTLKSGSVLRWKFGQLIASDP